MRSNVTGLLCANSPMHTINANGLAQGGLANLVGLLAG